jgi:pyridoxine kinase
LSEVKIVDMTTLTQAIQALHDKYRVPHVVITSVSLEAPDHPPSHLSVVGSSMTSTGKARLFKIVFPAIDCYFSGTGDMFAALMVTRMREAVYQSSPSLRERGSWLSEDHVSPLDLPLARAAERVLASMHEVLSQTAQGMKNVVEKTNREMREEDKTDEKRLHLVKSKAAELQLVRHLDCLRAPGTQYSARSM